MALSSSALVAVSQCCSKHQEEDEDEHVSVDSKSSSGNVEDGEWEAMEASAMQALDEKLDALFPAVAPQQTASARVAEALAEQRGDDRVLWLECSPATNTTSAPPSPIFTRKPAAGSAPDASGDWELPAGFWNERTQRPRSRDDMDVGDGRVVGPPSSQTVMPMLARVPLLARRRVSQRPSSPKPSPPIASFEGNVGTPVGRIGKAEGSRLAGPSVSPGGGGGSVTLFPTEIKEVAKRLDMIEQPDAATSADTAATEREAIEELLSVNETDKSAHFLQGGLEQASSQNQSGAVSEPSQSQGITTTIAASSSHSSAPSRSPARMSSKPQDTTSGPASSAGSDADEESAASDWHPGMWDDIEAEAMRAFDKKLDEACPLSEKCADPVGALAVKSGLPEASLDHATPQLAHADMCSEVEKDLTPEVAPEDQLVKPTSAGCGEDQASDPTFGLMVEQDVPLYSPELHPARRPEFGGQGGAAMQSSLRPPLSVAPSSEADTVGHAAIATVAADVVALDSLASPPRAAHRGASKDGASVDSSGDHQRRLERLLAGTEAPMMLEGLSFEELSLVAEDCQRAVETLRWVLARQQELVMKSHRAGSGRL